MNNFSRQQICGGTTLGVVLTLATLSGSLNPAQGAIIASYNFTSNSNSVDSEPNSTAGAFSHDFKAGAGTETVDVGRSAAAQFYFVRANRTDGTDEASAVSQEDYFTFTVTPNSGYKLDLSTLTFTLQAQRDSSAPNVTYPATTNIFIRTNVDGFAANIPGSATSATLTTSGSTNPTNALNVTATFGAAYDALTSATEFRIYVYDNQSTSQFFTRIDTVVLNGDALTVPEPASLALLGLGGLLMLPRRTKKA